MEKDLSPTHFNFFKTLPNLSLKQSLFSQWKYILKATMTVFVGMQLVSLLMLGSQWELLSDTRLNLTLQGENIQSFKAAQFNMPAGREQFSRTLQTGSLSDTYAALNALSHVNNSGLDKNSALQLSQAVNDYKLHSLELLNHGLSSMRQKNDAKALGFLYLSNHLFSSAEQEHISRAEKAHIDALAQSVMDKLNKAH